MKKQIITLGLAVCLLCGLTGCNDFLDREPLDKVTPGKYFSSENDLSAFTINAYPFETIDGSYGIGIFGKDNDTDNQAGVEYPSFWIPGQKKVASGEGDWKWDKIRACNYFFENVLPKYEEGTITGNQDNVKHYIGEMYVIRAYNYYKLLVSFGDLPIVTTALPDQEEALTEASKRQPRNLVARFILDDLQKASDLLLETAPGGKNRVGRNVAHLLRARVALFEATWEKYHKGTAFVPGGNGWPGNTADLPSGFNIDSEIAYFLDEAIKSSKIVGDAVVDRMVENTDAPEGMDASLASINPYYTMFCDENMENYSEILMWRQFRLGLVTNNIQMEMARSGGASGWSRGMVNSFLMRNGLPVYDSRSGYDPEWEKQGVNATLQNRDSRIGIFTKKPGDVNYYANDGTPDITLIDLIYGTRNSQATTGFIVKKGKHYSSVMANDHNSGTSGGIVFRATEAMLIYMEASYEKNRSIDQTADKYWRALRRRALVDEDYTKTIAATIMTEEAKGDFGAYSYGQLIDPTLYNIRRERRNELCAENFRWQDLKRWRACDQFKTTPYRMEGMLFWGSVYEQQLADKTVVDPENGTMSSPQLSPYIVPYEKVTNNNLIAAQNGFLFTPAHYLDPIGMAIFRQTAADKNDFSTSVVYQNPGWKIEGDTGAQPVE